MASSGSGYDLSSSTFSPDGRIFQVEYASKAVEQHAGLMMGMKCKDGVVLCVQKPLVQKLLVPTFSQRIYTIGSNMGMAVTGFQPDARQLIHRGREETADYVDTYGSDCPPSVLADRLATYVHYFTLHGSLRPFGAVGLVAGYDTATKTFSLNQVEPSGTSKTYYAAAAGKGQQAAKTELEKLVGGNSGASGASASGTTTSTETTTAELSCEEALKQLVRIVWLLHDPNKEKAFELEVSWITGTEGKHSGVPKETLDAATKWAKEQLEEEEDDDEDEDDDEEEEAMEE